MIRKDWQTHTHTKLRSHQAASTSIVEQRDIVRAILELSKQFGKIQVDPPNAQSNPPLPEHYTPGLQSPKLNDSSSQSLRGGSSCTLAESTPSDAGLGDKQLDLFLMKPAVQDLVDVIQLSWKVHRAQMQQAEIHEQVTRNQENGISTVSELYQDLYIHEHKAIEDQIAKAGIATSLTSLKRFHADLWHRKILFKGVPGLQFVLERSARQAFSPVAPHSLQHSTPPPPTVSHSPFTVPSILPPILPPILPETSPGPLQNMSAGPPYVVGSALSSFPGGIDTASASASEY